MGDSDPCPCSERPPSAVFDHGHAFSEGVPSEHKCSSVPPSSNAARLRRAGGLPPTGRRSPPPFCDRADSGPLAAFSSFRSVGMAGRPIPPSLQSEKRTQRPKLVAIAESPLRSDSTGPGSVLLPPRSARRLRRPWRCRYGPLLRPAIRHNLARASAHHLTTSRSPRDEALRNSATPTEGSERKVEAEGVRNSKLKTKNSKLLGAGRAENSKFEIRNSKSTRASYC